jgi:hypothetical protein
MRVAPALGPLLASGAVALCGCANPPPDGGAARSDGRRAVLAPIESAEIVVRESSPPQYALTILSGLPSGCAAFDRNDVERRGARVDVTVWNTQPVGAVACTMIYRTHDQTLALGSDFERGATYEIRINDATTVRFVAQ